GYDTGQYYILVAADYQNAVNESDESNNVVYKSFKIIEQNIDLEITALGVNNNSMPAGSYCYINYTLNNNGLTNCPQSSTSFYLSKDTVLNPLEDTYLGNSYNYAIGAGSYDNNNAYITIPSTVKNDNYYLFAVADMLNEIKETNELNNSKRILISVTESYIDLTITDATINSNSFQMYDDAYISFCLRNYGNIESPSGNIGYYISTDTVFDQNDILISQNYFSYIGPNNFTYVNRSVNIPYFPTFGQYFIIVVADNNNYIQEKSENNNTYIFPVTIVNQFLQPDLRGGWAIYNGYNLNMGDTLACDFYFSFNTIDTIQSFNTGYYLSKDTYHDNSDIYLGQVDINAPFVDTIVSVKVEFVIPDTITTGSYYILGIVDPFNQIPEPDEMNNVCYLSIQINEKIVDANEEHPIASSFIYPNPVTSELNIFNDSEYQYLHIFNASGVQVLNRMVFDNLNAIDVSDLLPGIYTVVLINGDETMKIQIVKVRD
ncbi:MAG: CARDB domain-containing protein, partial [Bacteroidales bacterium]